jgi:hypothetical protein
MAMELGREKVACGMAETGLRLRRWRKLLRGRPTKGNGPPPCLVDGTMKMVRGGLKNGQEQTWSWSRTDLEKNRLGGVADFSYWQCYEGRAIGRRMVP